jgi:protocatechuate 3,4-dioxygenase, alpha subunit
VSELASEPLIQKLGLTPSQTLGPFFSQALTWADGPYVVPAGTSGALWLRGRVLDGAGDGVPDAIVESWQADPAGRFNHPEDPRGADVDFRGFGRCLTDPEGHWAILTVRPGRVPGPNGQMQAPHVDISILARGLLDRVVTRIYFPDEDNTEDPVLSTIPEPRRSTLVAVAVPGQSGFQFDIRLQGERETVFFSV